MQQEQFHGRSSTQKTDMLFCDSEPHAFALIRPTIQIQYSNKTDWNTSVNGILDQCKPFVICRTVIFQISLQALRSALECGELHGSCFHAVATCRAAAGISQFNYYHSDYQFI